MLTQAQVESGIQDIVERLDDLTHEYATASDHAAESEHVYRIKRARGIVAMAGELMPGGTKSTADWREAQADIIAADEGYVYRMADARLRALREALSTHRARLDALRTLSANVRAQT